MKTAKEIRKIQENSIRDVLENNLVYMAKNRYASYTCYSVDCPKWLQEELSKKGFAVINDNDGITIRW